MISNGPPGRRAIVKWKPATKVFAGVYLVCEKVKISQSRMKHGGKDDSHHLIWFDQVMLDSFLQTHARSLLIF